MAGLHIRDGCLKRFYLQRVSALLLSIVLLNVSHLGRDEIGFSFHSDQDVSGFECSLDGSTFETCGLPRYYSGLSMGSHTFVVRAVNFRGDVAADPTIYKWSAGR